MSKARVKLAIFLVGLAVLVPVALIGVSLLSQFVTYFQQGAVPASIFRGNALIVPAPEQARWLDRRSTTGFTPDDGQSEEIIAAYQDAWDALARAYQTGDISALPTYWAGGAYTQVVDAVRRRAPSTLLTHSRHQLRLRFFSDDSSLVSFFDEGFRYRLSVAGVFDDLTANASVTMTLDSSVWRIRQIEIEVG